MQKRNRILNQIMMIFAATLIFVSALSVYGQLYVLPLDLENRVTYFAFYVGYPLFVALLLIINLILKYYFGGFVKWAILSFLQGLIFLSSYSLIIGPNANFGIYFLILLPLPFMVLGREELYLAVVGAVVTIAFFMGTMVLHEFVPTVLPMGEAAETWARYVGYINITPVFAACMYYLWFGNIENEELLEEERTRSEALRQRSDELLLNILPPEIAEELKRSESSKPKRYEEATVLFTDFVGFTSIAEKLEPEELIQELDLCFSYFDNVTKRYNLEKIKTIGDSYMLAGGLPEPNKTHAIDCVLAALEIQSFMTQMKEIKQAQGLPYWELRLGINTGPLVAGVIGEMKFAYDIFGDTVNLASRMESSGVSGKINISNSTFNLIKDLFDCEVRGEVQAKNKGMLQMYLVSGIKPEYSIAGDGRVPNDLFKEIYDQRY